MKPDFEKILKENVSFVGFNSGHHYLNITEVLRCMGVVWNQAVEQCAETAAVFDAGLEIVVHKQSILENKV